MNNENISINPPFQSMEHAILQNSACDIYQNYFEDIEQHELIEQFTSKTVHVYKDYLDARRSCSYITWSEEGLHFCSVHCNIGELKNTCTDSYIWDVGELWGWSSLCKSKV